MTRDWHCSCPLTGCYKTNDGNVNTVIRGFHNANPDQRSAYRYFSRRHYPGMGCQHTRDDAVLTGIKFRQTDNYIARCGSVAPAVLLPRVAAFRPPFFCRCLLTMNLHLRVLVSRSLMAKTLSVLSVYGSYAGRLLTTMAAIVMGKHSHGFFLSIISTCF